MKKIFFLALAALMLPMMSFAQERIMVISDPHVIPQTEIAKRADFKEYMKTQRKMLDLSEPIWHALLDTALKYKPDLVLIPGDLTKDGEEASHDTVSAGIHRLEAAGIPVLIIPGNHDIPGANWETLYSGTFDGAVKDELGGSHSFARHNVLPGVTVLGIDGSDGNASIGKLSQATLDWIKAQAETAKANGNTVIAMTHWQILEHFDGVATLEPASRFEKPDELRDLLMHNGVHLVLTGHFHVSGITTFRDITGLTQDSLVEITTGSPITYPCPYRWMTLAKDRKSIEVTTEYINSLPGIDDDFLTYSREWMREHTSNLVPSLARKFWKKIFDNWDEKVVPKMGAYTAMYIKSFLPDTEEKQVAITETYMKDPAINMYLFYSEASEANHPKEGEARAEAMYEGLHDLMKSLFMETEDDIAGEMTANAFFEVVKPEIEGSVQSLVEDKTLRATKHADVTDDLELVLGKQEKSTIHAVNQLEWEKVYAYVWCKVGEKVYPYKPWPGVEVLVPKSAPARIKAGSINKIFTFEFPKDYDHVSFNNGKTGGEKQESIELTWKESEPYFVLSGEKDGEGHYKGDWKAPSDIAAVQDVENKIEAIGTVEYPASKDKIDAARAAYKDLKDDLKPLVSNLATLEAAEKAYEAAEKAAKDKAAAEDVDVKIEAIGTVEYPASKDKIDAARAAYNALNDDQKALVTKLATLEAAEKTYADKAAAKGVDDKIEAIGTVEYPASKDKIDAARAAYDALTADQKAFVTKLTTLEDAEKAYDDLKKAAEKAAADKEAANAVDVKIESIGVVAYTDESKALIDAARAAYNALTDDQKALVTKLATLEAAEKTYEDLKKEAETPTGLDNQSSDINIHKVLRDGKMYILVGEKMYDGTGRLVE